LTAEREEVRARPVDGLSVLIGVEVDYQVRFEPEVRQFMDAADYDFVIGSVHYAQGRYASSDSYFAGGERAAYSAYLNEALQAARSGLFDVLGHLDIVKRRGVRHYGPFDPARYAQAIDAILRACVDTGTGLEINASGLRESPRETYPTLPVIRRYRELGGEILTVGSDAHRAIDLARGIPDAVALAREAGFRAITLFVDRQPRWLPMMTEDRKPTSVNEFLQKRPE
jgi:histidinol-phosphatase (PHP family)